MRPGFPKAEVVRRNGVPTLSVNGVFHPGIFGYVGWNWLTARQSIRDFGKAGFHLYEIVFQPWSLWKNGKLDVGELERKLNSQIVSVAAQDPEAMFFLRYWLYVPRDWSKFHPGEVIRYDDGSSEIPLLGGPWAHASYASVLWREEYKRMLRELIARLEKGPYADRVFMVRAGYGNCGEWNNFGYHQNKFPDYSPQMQAAYRMWLKRRYGTLDALNRSWKSSFVDWSLIDIPSRAERLAGEGTLLRTSSGSGNCGDYYRFFSDYTVELIGDFGRTVKEASGGKLLFGVFYGYFLHHLTGVPYHSLDSGHYAMGKLLRLPEVDTVCSPYNYHRRERAISIGMPLESIKHHGKLFLAEMDLPTHLADAEKYHGTAGESFSSDRAEADTMTLYRRDFGRVLTWGTGGYWYDFAHGWYEFDAFRKFIADAARIGRTAVNGDMRSIAEVAVILDEESVFSISLHSGEWAKQLRETLGCTLESAGAPVDFWLASDLGAAVKRGYRLLVFGEPLPGGPGDGPDSGRFPGDASAARPGRGAAGTCVSAGPLPARSGRAFRRRGARRAGQSGGSPLRRRGEFLRLRECVVPRHLAAGGEPGGMCRHAAGSGAADRRRERRSGFLERQEFPAASVGTAPFPAVPRGESVVAAALDEEHADEFPAPIAQLVLARRQDAHRVAGLEAELLLLENEVRLSFEQECDLLLEVLRKAVVGLPVRAEHHHQQFHVGFQRSRRQVEVDRVFFVRVVDSFVLGPAADQRSVVDFLDEQRRKRNSECLAD